MIYLLRSCTWTVIDYAKYVYMCSFEVVNGLQMRLKQTNKNAISHCVYVDIDTYI